MKCSTLFGLAAAVVTVAGCAHRLSLSNELQALVGQDIHGVVARIGYPTAQRQVLGDTLYVWSTSNTVSSLAPVTTNSYGTVGTGYATGTINSTSTTFVPTQETYRCTLQLAVDRDNRIKGWQWDGNGCGGYAQRLKPLPPVAASSAPRPASIEQDRIVDCARADGTRLGLMLGRDCLARNGQIR